MIYSSDAQDDDEEQQDDNSWAVSYGDVITLLLVFFVIIVSASKLSSAKLDSMQKAIRGEQLDEKPHQALVKVLQETLEKNGLQEEVSIIEDDDGLRLVIRDSLIFASGQARIPNANRKKFQPILNALKNLPPFYRFHVEGHTDDVPITTEKFPSNWYLGASRAIAVAEIFFDQGFDPKRISTHSFADTRPVVKAAPVAELSATQRRRNRRVEIKIK